MQATIHEQATEQLGAVCSALDFVDKHGGCSTFGVLSAELQTMHHDLRQIFEATRGSTDLMHTRVRQGHDDCILTLVENADTFDEIAAAINDAIGGE